MASHQDDDFDALLEKSSLGGSAARRLRERTPLSRAQTVHRIVELRHRIAYPGGEPQQALQAPPDLPLEFEAFYLAYQQFFHDFAELHLGSRPTAEQVVHQVFLEILMGWEELQQADVEQQAQAILRSHVIQRLQKDTGNNGVRFLEYVRSQLEIDSSTNDLYNAILELPEQQFTVIVLRYVLGYPTDEIARYMGVHRNTVAYRIRRGQERLRTSLLPTARAQTEKEAWQ
ncbi:sigma-70 family RNA polymerase sigma factor [Streptomyces sp. NWU339]|uniref:sigma-70 family RNA polymerase sigma factor n=1 Tax=Streptomyces sp. NWU339 TaxID=2185284 RepID=UPI000D672970|nr:sigma-70 family RNA polymerase sigma factor [Streptomyces sp. NWU339]PWI05117.1 sigma-70 family RNA polymerase sigma factor [Streptomyces sp. NWU339]